MKKFALIIIALLSIRSYSQCVDVFDKNVPCPTQDDSMVIYNNSLLVYNFYENNKSYKKLNFYYIKTKSDRIDIFTKMKSARNEYLQMINKNSEYIKNNNLLTGLSDLPFAQYYNVVDAWRFYQRELEYKIVNDDAPFPLYDSRISPITVCVYKNMDNRSEFFNDEVNIPMYIPVTVKPYILLTEAEKIQRAEILAKVESVKNKIEFEKKLTFTAKRTIAPPVSTPVPYSPTFDSIPTQVKTPLPTVRTAPRIPAGATPVYCDGPYGGGWLMGYMIGRRFRKFYSTDEYYWALPKEAKRILENDNEIEALLRLYFGEYYEGFYE
jgi:hypothetical protein